MAPVQERSRSVSAKTPYHVVSKGETLFSIAWRYGLNYKTLATYNGFGAPYTIYPGQKLRLNPVSTSSSVRAQGVSSSRQSTLSRTSNQTVARGIPQPTPTTSVGQLRSKSPTPQPAVPKVVKGGNSSVTWQWPLRGKIITNYASSQGLSKGIDIAGRLGESVLAAGPGTVVYSGSGLRGYGNLLIIKHNELFLSAYAHSDKLLVKEGESVKAGQKIAEVGSSGTDKVMLHFEIRRDGAPVDPMQYLPR